MTAFEIISGIVALIALPLFVYSIKKLFSSNMKLLDEKRKLKIEESQHRVVQKQPHYKKLKLQKAHK